MKEVKQFIQKVFEDGVLPFDMTIGDFRELGECYNNLKYKNEAFTIYGEVAKFYKNNNFTVSNYGTGFRIYI